MAEDTVGSVVVEKFKVPKKVEEGPLLQNKKGNKFLIRIIYVKSVITIVAVEVVIFAILVGWKLLFCH